MMGCSYVPFGLTSTGERVLTRGPGSSSSRCRAQVAGVSDSLQGALMPLRDAKPNTIEMYTRIEVHGP